MSIVRKIVIASPDFAREIEDFRFRGRFKTETEALRALIRVGLDAAKAKCGAAGAAGGFEEGRDAQLAS
jgi:hypothetical protein